MTSFSERPSAFVLALLCCAASASLAAEPTGALKKFKDNGTITIGYRESSIPFSYLDDKAQPVGYSLELCGRIVDAIRSQIGTPTLQVKHQSVTSQNRIPLVVNGTVDLECGSTVNNLERQQQVAFSVTTFVVATRFVGFKSANLKTLDDLRGKTVAVTTGTNTMKRVRELDAARKLNLNILAGKDHADSLLLVATGRAAAFFEDDILLTGLVAAAQNAGDYALSTEGYSVDPYAIMFAKDDPALKKVVNDTLVAMFRSGEVARIYDKWFLKPIQPKGITLGFPMGAALKKAIAAPTDSADPASYL